MGCASSRQCRQKSRKKMWRSMSMEMPQSPSRMSSADQTISLKSTTTLGSLIRHSTPAGSPRKKEFSIGVVEAKAWSTMIEDKIPKKKKTPSSTPPGEPEAVIDVWELMSDLQQVTPLRSFRHGRSFSFDLPPVPPSETTADDKAEMGILSSFRKAMEELSPEKLSSLRSPEKRLSAVIISPEKRGGRRLVEGHREDRVVVYLTSLRGVRKTYEECGEVKVILRGMGVKVEERDVSMDAGFRDELRGLLGGGLVQLPMVFVGRRELGGAAEVRRLHEDGRLVEELSGCGRAADGGVCRGCGDVRFLACDTCWGSCKIHCEWGEGEEEDEECGFRRCPDCNENGVRRCPICLD